MSGHSKWHNIQAKKGKADSPRVTEELQLLTNGRVEMLLEETSFRAWEAGEQNA